MIQMPKLEPIAIPTKGKSWWYAWYIWLFKTRRFRVIEDFTYRYDSVNYLVPKGFIFDGASVPRFLWWFITPTGILLIPALFHDYIYSHHYYKVDTSAIGGYTGLENVSVSREFADYLFREMAVDINGFKFPAYAAWLAVRIGGYLSWRG